MSKIFHNWRHQALICVVLLLVALVGIIALSRPDSGARTAHQDVHPLADILTVNTTPGFAKAAVPRTFHFPVDHAAHPGYAVEWWYYTGIVRSSDDRQFGYQVTFFRVGLVPSLPHRTSGWATRDVLLGHFAITDIKNKRFTYHQKIGRPVLKIAGYDTKQLNVFIGKWKAIQQGKTMQLEAAAGRDQVKLSLTTQRLPVQNGVRGLSQKGSDVGNANYYYSIPRMDTVGVLTADGKRFGVKGMSWMDHEWGTSKLAPNQKGWDWFSLRLSDGRDLMLYQMRDSIGRPTEYSSGTLVQKNGKSLHLTNKDFSVVVTSTWTSPATNARYPSGWYLTVPKSKINLAVRPMMKNQELVTKGTTDVTYWEGAIAGDSALGETRLDAEGYAELTGYAGENTGIQLR